MKLIIDLQNINNLDNYINKGISAFILGLKDYSIYNSEFTVKQIEEITKKYNNIEFFVAINKNIFNKELDDLKDKLITLDKLKIKGILFYDLAILNLKNELNLKVDLVWNQTHMVTNYNTCNFYYENGVKYGYISNELTIDEIIEINNNSKMKFMTMIYGHPIMSHSKRKLLTNYYKAKNEELKKNVNEISEKDNKYIIKETKDGASIIYGNIINGSSILKTLIDNNFAYGIIKEDFIDIDILNKLLDNLTKYIKDYDDKYIKEIDNLIGNDTNFFYKKTIFKVK